MGRSYGADPAACSPARASSVERCQRTDVASISNQTNAHRLNTALRSRRQSKFARIARVRGARLGARLVRHHAERSPPRGRAGARRSCRADSRAGATTTWRAAHLPCKSERFRMHAEACAQATSRSATRRRTLAPLVARVRESSRKIVPRAVSQVTCARQPVRHRRPHAHCAWRTSVLSTQPIIQRADRRMHSDNV
jgi:hypothetical protein